MARRVFRGPALRQGQRRKSLWLKSFDITTTSVLAAATAAVDQTFTGAQIEALGPLTITRVRGTIWVASDQASASEEPFGALAFAVVSEQARAVGITAVPAPITDEASDLFFAYQAFQAYFATGQGVTWQRYDYDSKAMRKVNTGEGIVVTIENAHATFGLEFINKFRMLVKLS